MNCPAASRRGINFLKLDKSILCYANMTFYKQVWVNLVLLLSFLSSKFFFNRKVVERERIRRIMIFQLEEIGDIVLATPVLAAVRHHFPGAHITMVVGEWIYELLQGEPTIDKVVTYNSNLAGNVKKHRIGLMEHIRRVYSLSREEVDLVIDLRGNLGSILVALLGNARYRADRGTFRCRDIFRKGRLIDHNKHEVQINLDILKQVGITEEKPYINLAVQEIEREKVKDILKAHQIDGSRKLVAIHPGASWEGKRWDKGNFAALADKIMQHYDVTVVLTGSKDELPLTRKVAELMKKKPVNLTGELSLRLLLALYERCLLWIGNDTGPMHLAVAVQKPVVALYGPTSPEKFGPSSPDSVIIRKEISCSPCKQHTCRFSTYRCMEAVSVEDVWKKITETAHLTTILKQ